MSFLISFREWRANVSLVPLKLCAPNLSRSFEVNAFANFFVRAARARPHSRHRAERPMLRGHARGVRRGVRQGLYGADGELRRGAGEVLPTGVELEIP